MVPAALPHAWQEGHSTNLQSFSPVEIRTPDLPAPKWTHLPPGHGLVEIVQAFLVRDPK